MINIKEFIKKSKIVMVKKVPTNKERYIGVEVELVSPVSKDMLAFFITQAGLQQWVNVGTDDSIDCDDEDYGDGTEWGLECRILCKEKEIKKILPKFFSLVREVGCRVNDSCGLHVHLDARTRNYAKMLKNLYASQELMFSVVNDDRRDNSYCRPLTKYEYERALTGSMFDLRRTAINALSYNKHKTIEIRLHHGSLNVVDVVSWIKLLISIVNLKTPVDGWELTTSKFLSISTKTWINRKVRQYGKHTIREETIASGY